MLVTLIEDLPPCVVNERKRPVCSVFTITYENRGYRIPTPDPDVEQDVLSMSCSSPPATQRCVHLNPALCTLLCFCNTPILLVYQRLLKYHTLV